MSSASLILTDRGLALSEPKVIGAQGNTKVLAASSLGSGLVFVSSAVVTVALAAIGRDMRLSPLDLQWVMNAELLPLAALPVVAGALAGGALWIPKDSPTSHARVDVGGAVLSTVRLGGLGAGLTSLTNGSGLNLWVLLTLIVGLGGLAGLIVTERRLGDNAMLPPFLFALRSVAGANLFTALLYGPFTVMLTLIPFVMIRGAHLPTVVAGLALPLFAGGAVVALGCAMALRVGPNATYWADFFPPSCCWHWA